MVLKKAMVYIIIIMVINIMDNGSMIKKMVKVHINIITLVIYI